ncbi:LysR family transcriptional regulator [Companilactobacillus paralimentarius]|uniref:LysR family transcriptional regulator n=1 Tax=Companilactobacillus paralimentarius TaxID=83526 RepID=UPI0038505244
MTDFYLLEALVAFAKYGTLAKASEHLGLTQPELTHSMKNLEETLGVQLFIRRPNKLSLTETGEYAVQEAQKLINDNYKFANKVSMFEQNQAVIAVGANAPGPLIVVRSLNKDHLILKTTHIQKDFMQILSEEQITCLLTNQSIETSQINSIYLGTERMAINLPSDSPLLKAKDLKFADLAGGTFLCPQEIGFWKDIYESEIPNGKFIYQNQSSEYRDLLNYSSLPFFTTNLTKLDPKWGKNLPSNRIIKSLSDQSAHQQFYINFLKRNQKRLTSLIQEIQDQWAQVDF